MCKTKTRRLALYLIKESYQDWKNCLKEDVDYTAYDLLPQIDFQGKILIGVNRKNDPHWFDFLQEGCSEAIDPINNASNRALLFLSVEERLFVITFGYGRHIDYFMRRDA